MLASFARSALHAARPVARAAAPALARRLCSTPAAEPTTNTGRNVMLLGSGAAACAGLQVNPDPKPDPGPKPDLNPGARAILTMGGLW